MIRSRGVQWLLLLTALCLYFWYPFWNVGQALTNNDFKHIYLGMKALLDGNSPYPIQSLHHQAALQGYRQITLNPYVYLPFTGHAMAFLAPFTLQQAVIVWFILNHLFLFGSVYILSGLFPRWRIGAAGLMLLSMAFSMPLYRTLSAGQLNLALLFMLCAAWRLARQHHSHWYAAILAFAALFKLMPGIYGVQLLLRRQWQAAATMALAGLLFLAASIALAGPRYYLDFLPVLQQMGYGKSTWPHVFSFWDDPPNQSPNSFFTHVFAENDHTTPWILLGQGWANGFTVVATLLLGVAYILVVFRRPAPASEHNPMVEDAVWGATLLLGLLIPSLLWDHYLVMLLLPVSIMTRIGIDQKRYYAMAMVAACYILTCIPWNFEDPTWRTGAGILLMSLKLWPTLALFGLSLCFIVWSGKSITPAGPAASTFPDFTEPEITR